MRAFSSEFESVTLTVSSISSSILDDISFEEISSGGNAIVAFGLVE